MKDELIALAKEVGFCVADAAYPYTVKPVASAEQLERFANAADNQGAFTGMSWHQAKAVCTAALAQIGGDDARS